MVCPIICGNAMACGQVCQCTGSLQLSVLRLGLLEDGDVGVGVFPEGEEVLVRSFRFGGFALHEFGASETKMRECPDGFVYYNSAMVENFLKLSSGFAPMMSG